MTEFLDDVIAGLSATPKSLPSKYLYDERGSALFEEITRLPEYYPTRAETALLAEIAPELASQIPDGAAVVEFGSGSSAKTTLLLDAAPQVSAYAPIDISPEALGPAAARIARRYPNLETLPVSADFTGPVVLPPGLEGRLLVGFFPGSTIGNFGPGDAVEFLAGARRSLGPEGQLIVGFDLVKDPAVLVAAYDDAAGITAAFNLNLLVRINRELAGTFVMSNFSHRAVWNAHASRMEMHLESLVEQTAATSAKVFRFSRGETIHTESSHKYTVSGFEELGRQGGWRVQQTWTSPAPTGFGVTLLGAG